MGKSPSLDAAPQIKRFHPGERMMHWALAGPFLLLYASALGLAVFYAEPQPRLIHGLFAVMHRIAGVLLIALPPLALVRGAADWRAHLENMREGWWWTRDDIRWLMLFPRNAVNPKVALPEEGKFNAAEKLNFMMVTVTYPLYIVTGLMVWMPGTAFFPWVAHVAAAVLGLPLVLGHMFMAAVNPATRVGLSGMITGWVDREWAKHHYRRWFRERIEIPEQMEAAAERARLLASPSRVRCGTCESVSSFGSWEQLLEQAFRVQPLVCTTCLEPLQIVDAVANPAVAEAILGHLEKETAGQPFDQSQAEVA